MTDATFVMHSEWLEDIAGLPTEQQDKIIGEVVRYGMRKPLKYKDDSDIQAFVDMIKEKIDCGRQAEKRLFTRHRSNRKINDEEVWELAREGMTAEDIADIFNCCKSTIDHCEGWKRRKEEVLLLY
jgi:DNA-binding NarL/FixJ family response regulator